jgi:ribonucleoside-triphosphate reductase (thioredoxin)
LSEHSYKQAPYQEVTKEEYEQAVKSMPSRIPWESLPLYELEDTTTGSQELACVASSGGFGCDVDITPEQLSRVSSSYNN